MSFFITGNEYHGVVVIAVVDNDGDLDIISIDWSRGRALLYENRAVAP